MGGPTAGGALGRYPRKRLYEELAFLGYYLHWDYGTLMNLEHRDRRLWCEEVSEINKGLNDISQKSISLENLP